MSVTGLTPPPIYRIVNNVTKKKLPQIPKLRKRGIHISATFQLKRGLFNIDFYKKRLLDAIMLLLLDTAGVGVVHVVGRGVERGAGGPLARGPVLNQVLK